MLQPTLEKNDSKAKVLIWTVSIIVFVAVVILSKVKLLLDLPFNVHVFANINAVTKGLFHLLFENKRFEILGEIATEYNNLNDEANGVQVAKVTTAIAMDANLEAKVLAKIATFSDKKITIENTIDPSIIGGFILRIGDKQYNASIANRLQVLKRELSN